MCEITDKARKNEFKCRFVIRWKKILQLKVLQLIWFMNMVHLQSTEIDMADKKNKIKEAQFYLQQNAKSKQKC